MSLMPPSDPVTSDPVWNDQWDSTTGGAAAKILGDVWKNEESRFSNLNTRGVAVISAASVVSALLGFFSKNLLDSTPSQLSDSLRVAAQTGLGASIGFLVLTIGIIVLGVLRPGSRAVFGNNEITAGAALTAPQVDRVVFLELGQIYRALVNRNSKKAHWLNWGYLTFFTALLSASGTAVYVLANFTPPTV